MDHENHYSKAPITEAILDIQVEARDGLAVASLAHCQEGVHAAYPTKRELKSTFARFDLGQQIEATASSQEVGFAFVSSDGKQLFQVRPNGFTANRLAPYSGWSTFCDEARKLWNIYRENARPARVTRIALRYINRIDIPVSPVDLREYFHTSPEVAPGLPQSMAGFFMQILLTLEDVKAMVNIVETIIEPPQPGTVSVVLDLDLFRTVQIPATEDELWGLFDELRVKKNTVFDACITQKTMELLR